MARGLPPTADELAKLEEWQRLRDAGLDCGQIARREGQTTDYIRSKLARYNLHWRKEQPKEFHVIDLGKPLELNGDAVVVGDLHLPTLDYEFAIRAGDVAKKQLPEGHRRLIIGGDCFNMEPFSTYPRVTRLTGWHEERDAARIIFAEWLKVFDEIYVIMGNHDRRMQKWSGGELDETDIFGMVLSNPRLTVSNWGWLTMQTKTGLWRITHSSEYSINAGTVGSELAHKFQMHIISHHQHHANAGLDRYKRYATIDNGCMADFSQFAYVQLDDNKKANMTNAFTLLKDGVGHLLWKHPALTDWGFWL
jgi:hypothetical protein